MRFLFLKPRHYLKRPAVNYRRSMIVDALRGVGILCMVLFHFFYDLTLFNLAEIPIYSSAPWIVFRYVILSLFLVPVGMALSLHHRRGMNWRNYARRLAILVICAALITLATYFTLGDAFIYFGILHLIALASVLGLLFVRLHWINLCLAILILWFGFFYEHSVFNHYPLRWIGMLSVPSGSADFTPIFPWFGLVLLGIFIARLVGEKIYWNHQVFAPLEQLGRYSLRIYMLHQPVLWALIYVYILLGFS